ncbi:3-oxoadipate enol-lactonase [Devosia psychrophila]|uniref:3-oxoadipate enol-lactonase n=1 Tax=Devosia psychrophila TaxID=728005 RepID=A0A0F5PZ80_9HYPH|nr:3-oxoadipate enol-lactonase [Devosia psychrophila]KKC33915.1 3-oxoadipate enol-lactonase [Devosia psychrophila]SFC84385.1 3-oxoadipate enol-lactonase [Devosia psychrophila]
MAFVRINGILLHYRLAGPPAAPAIVLVNSLGTDARIWDQVVALMSGYYRILSYDKRGHGLSDAPPGDYALEHHVDDLAGLLQHLDINHVAVVGVSVGGLIAQAFALRHPDRLSALVLCDTAAKVGDETMWNSRIAAVRENGIGSLAETIMARWFTESFRRDRREELAGWQNMVLRMPLDGYAGTCAALRDADLRGSIAAITTPTLVVVGDQDLSTPVELVRDMANRIADSRFEIIGDCGHIPSIEQPHALVSLITAFLEEAGHG